MLKIIFILLFGWLRIDALFIILSQLGRTDTTYAGMAYDMGKKGGTAIPIFLSSVTFWGLVIGGCYLHSSGELLPLMERVFHP